MQKTISAKTSYPNYSPELKNMVESPVISKSTIFYQIAIFLILQVWAIMIFEVSQYQMVTLYETPLEWLGWASALFLTLMPVLSVLVWKMKDCVHISNADWNYRTREVTFDEFSHMIKEYNHRYGHLISFLDIRFPPLAMACYVGALFLPFPLMRSTMLLISLTPIILAAILVVFGILFSYLLFRFIPNSTTQQFPNYRPRIFRKSIRFLAQMPGIYWCGIRLNIGELNGYYTIRSPHPVARIEGIEGAARIDCSVDAAGSISSIVALLDSDTSHEPTIVGKATAPITATNVALLIRKILDTYIEKRGGEDVLDEVLEEINMYLEKHEPMKTQNRLSDGLISSGDQEPAKEEST
jgi:hypothetical protein